MSTLKADAVTAQSTNQDLDLSGNGTGVPDIAAGFKVGSVAGVPTASIQDDAITLAKLAAGTDGELITWDASGDPAAVAVGTATHVLTSNGAGAAPTFQAAGGGGAWSVLSSSTFSTASTVDINTGTTKLTKIFFTDVISSANTIWGVRTSTDGGSTFDSGGSDYRYVYTRQEATTFTSSQITASNFEIGGPGQINASTANDMLIELTIANPGDTVKQTLLYGQFSASGIAGDIILVFSAGRRSSAADIDAIQLLPITSGTITGAYAALELN